MRWRMELFGTETIVLILSGVSLLFLIGIGVSLEGEQRTPGRMWLLLLGVLVVPCMTMLFGIGAAMDEAKQVDFCGTNCHEMAPYYADLKDPESTNLAAVHYQNRYILTDQCYNCHTQYTMFGGAEAKLAGLRHVWHHYTGSYEKPIKIRGEYKIANCLHCHGEAKRYREKHSAFLAAIDNGEMSCLNCHAQIHPKQALAKVGG